MFRMARWYVINRPNYLRSSSGPEATAPVAANAAAPASTYAVNGYVPHRHMRSAAGGGIGRGAPAVGQATGANKGPEAANNDNDDDDAEEEEDDDDTDALLASMMVLPEDLSSVDPAVLSTLPTSLQLDILEKMRDAQMAGEARRDVEAGAGGCGLRRGRQEAGIPQPVVRTTTTYHGLANLAYDLTLRRRLPPLPPSPSGSQP